MSRENVKKFYDLVASDRELAKSLNGLDKEVQLKTSDFAKLKDLVEEKIIPLAKKRNLEFSADELIEYANKKYMELSDEDLLDVSGGLSPRNTAIGLASVLFLSLGTAATVNLLPSSPEQSQSISTTYSKTDEENNQADPRVEQSQSEDVDSNSDEINSEAGLRSESATPAGQITQDGEEQALTENFQETMQSGVQPVAEQAADNNRLESSTTGAPAVSSSTTANSIRHAITAPTVTPSSETPRSSGNTDSEVPPSYPEIKPITPEMLLAGAMTGNSSDASVSPELNAEVDAVAKAVANYVEDQLSKLYNSRHGSIGASVPFTPAQLTSQARSISNMLSSSFKSEIGLLDCKDRTTIIHDHDSTGIKFTIRSADDKSSITHEIDVLKLCQNYQDNIKNNFLKSRPDAYLSSLRSTTDENFIFNDMAIKAGQASVVEKAILELLPEKPVTYGASSNDSNMQEIAKTDAGKLVLFNVMKNPDAIVDHIRTIKSYHFSMDFPEGSAFITLDNVNNSSVWNESITVAHAATADAERDYNTHLSTVPFDVDAVKKILDDMSNALGIPSENSVSYTQFGHLGRTATQQAKHLLETLNKISSFEQVKSEDLAGLKADIQHLADQLNKDESGKYYFAGRTGRGYWNSNSAEFERIINFAHEAGFQCGFEKTFNYTSFSRSMFTSAGSQYSHIFDWFKANNMVNNEQILTRISPDTVDAFKNDVTYLAQRITKNTAGSLSLSDTGSNFAQDDLQNLVDLAHNCGIQCGFELSTT